MELVWAIIKVGLLSKVNEQMHPEIATLADFAGEELEEMRAEQVLLAWANYHLKRAKFPKKLQNFSSDTKDLSAYIHLFSQLYPDKFDLSLVDITDEMERAEEFLKRIKDIGFMPFVEAEDIINVTPSFSSPSLIALLGKSQTESCICSLCFPSQIRN